MNAASGRTASAVRLCAALAAWCAVVAGSQAVIAAPYPERPIRMIVPQAIGSSTDNVARIVATELAREIGQQVVVDNRPGGALQLGLGSEPHPGIPEDFWKLVRSDRERCGEVIKRAGAKID